MMNPKKYLYSIGLLTLLACDPDEPRITSDTNSPSQVGYRPVYGSADSGSISWGVPQAIKDPGKIYVYGKYLLVNEVKKGIHVYDNTNPEIPVALGFLKVLGNTDMAIKDGVMYVDHMDNLVALKIDDFTAIEEKGRLTLSNWNLGVPPPKGFHFECVEPSQGMVIEWVKTEQQNLKCYALH